MESGANAGEVEGGDVPPRLVREDVTRSYFFRPKVANRVATVGLI